MRERDRVKLLYGPYRPPRLRVGDRATCLYRDCAVVVTSITAARISWPRCKRLEGKGAPTILGEEELARARPFGRRVDQGVKNDEGPAYRSGWAAFS